MSQIGQGIKGQGVPGNMNPRTPWRTTPSNPGPAIDGRPAEEGDSAEQAERDLYWQLKMLEERKEAAAQRAERAAKEADRAAPPPKKRIPFGPAAGVAAELKRIDPSGMRQISVGLEARCDALGWRLEHLGATIGTVIHGPDLSVEQTDEAIAAIYDVLLERKMVGFRDQDITEDQQMAFGLRFGPLEIFPWAVKEDADAAILPQVSAGPIASGASTFHSDVTWRKSPSLGSMLYCDEAPPFGGDTAFADTYASWRGLREEDREMLRGMYCVHDFDSFRQGQLAQGVTPETVEAVRQAYPVARHPMVRTHPDTGGEMLYVNPNFGRYVEADGQPIDEAESDLLLERLYAQCLNPEYQCSFRCKRERVFLFFRSQMKAAARRREGLDVLLGQQKLHAQSGG